MSSPNMTEAYKAAMAKSYANQEGGVTIPADQLDQVVEIQTGFQPLGVCARPLVDGSDKVAIACYFEPAVCLANVKRDEKGIHFVVSHIRGINHGIQSVRLFPDIFQAGGANRAQCVLHGFEGNILVSRNGERDFYVLSWPDQPNGRWTLTAKLTLPANGEMVMLHAADRIDEDTVFMTVESKADLTSWHLCQYRVSTRGIETTEEPMPMPDYTYGITVRDGKVWTITDFRSSAPHGIYCGDRLAVPEVCGTGLAFLSDGSALVARYGQS